MGASITVMLSYDYNHFEICLSDDGIDPSDIQAVNELRKKVQRLADEAVRQYKQAKEMAAKKEQSNYERALFENQCKEIERKPEGERTINEMAILKHYQDEDWMKKFDYDYDYDDDVLLIKVNQ